MENVKKITEVLKEQGLNVPLQALSANLQTQKGLFHVGNKDACQNAFRCGAERLTGACQASQRLRFTAQSFTLSPGLSQAMNQCPSGPLSPPIQAKETMRRENHI